ncbi:MAG: hypothetical protein K0U29_04455 [Gammaproteobacteria bacterium]|nr:hypothetical protein [Gammaproteobacteria bacterium]MCH9744167.1 hypothetical protein [Gammaproteobacteria bacterium]
MNFTESIQYTFLRPFAGCANGAVNGMVVALGICARRSSLSEGGEFLDYFSGEGRNLMPVMTWLGAMIGYVGGMIRDENNITPDKFDLLATAALMVFNLVNFSYAISGVMEQPGFSFSL